MNKFVAQPLEEKLNRENMVTRLRRVEDAVGARPSATVQSLSELSANAGDQMAGTYFVIDQNTGAVRGYLTAVPRAEAPGYYLAFFNSAGVFQFGVNADNGQAVAGAGAVTLDEDGISIAVGVGDANKIKWMEGTNSVFHIYESGAGDYYARIRADYFSAGTYRNNVTFVFEPYYYKASITGGDFYVTQGGIIVNDEGEDKDSRIEGDTDAKLTVWDAGLDAVAIGGDAESGVKLKVYGKTNLAGSPVTTNMLTRAPTSVGQGTWTRTVNASYLYNGVFYNSSSANGDNFTINMYLPAGTYTVRFNAAKSANRGIVKVEVGTTNLGNTDLYAAADNFLNIAEYTGLVIATGGAYDVKFTVNGKNASSSNYLIDIGGIEFIRTA